MDMSGRKTRNSIFTLSKANMSQKIYIPNLIMKKEGEKKHIRKTLTAKPRTAP